MSIVTHGGRSFPTTRSGNDEDDEHRRTFRETFARTGRETLRALLIVSGGAAVAYLAIPGGTFADEGGFKAFGSEAAMALIPAM